MRSRAAFEGLGIFASPTAGVALGAVGFLSAVLTVLTDATAAAIASAAALLAVTALAVYALRVNAAFDGPYRVLESETIWDLQDPDASKAIATKRQNVRFNYKTYVAQDTATTDTGGDPFAGYSADHGVLITTFQVGAAHHALIKLHAEGQRGDEARFVSHRPLHNQFPKDHDEWIEIEQSQRGKTALVVMFPSNRPPHNPRHGAL